MNKQISKIHTPVLLDELISNLKIKPSGFYVDCTAGFGGHSSEIAKRLSTGHLLCIDQDQIAIDYLNRIFKDKKNVFVAKNNFVNLDILLEQKVDGIIMDLGVSSLMFDDPLRGFSYKHDGPLDMRMNQDTNLTAGFIINNYTRAELINLFKQYADVRDPNKVVDTIIKCREKCKIDSTTQLAEIIASCFKGSLIRKHPAKVYFQALRIEVNNELELLKQALVKALGKLKSGGRLCVITFHSLEDRIVKNFFKEKTEIKDLYGKEAPVTQLSKPEFKLITKKPIVPSEQEIQTNRRSHSAKLRIIEKI